MIYLIQIEMFIHTVCSHKGITSLRLHYNKNPALPSHYYGEFPKGPPVDAGDKWQLLVIAPTRVYDQLVSFLTSNHLYKLNIQYICKTSTRSNDSTCISHTYVIPG